MKINKSKEMDKELAYIYSLHGMSKDALRREAINNRAKALALQSELDTMKFVLQDASEDLIPVSKAKYLLRKEKQNR